MKAGRYLSVLLCVMILSAAVPAAAAQPAEEMKIEAAAARGAAYLLTAVPAPVSADVGGEWTVLALARLQAGGEKQMNAYIRNLRDKLDSGGGVLSSVKYSEYARAALAVTALGYDARRIGGYDLLAPLYDMEKTGNQGVNGLIFALLAWSGREAYREASEEIREAYLNSLLSEQLPDGSFSLTETGDPDVTAMAVQALAAYRDRDVVSAAAERAVQWLSVHQGADGGFENWGIVNPESTAQVILALSEYGIPVDDPAFVKEDGSLVSHLLSFQREDGGFAHTREGESEIMTTEQAVCALTAMVRRQRGGAAFYDMSDVTARNTEVPGPAMAEGVKPVPVTEPGKTFADIAGHPAAQAIEALAARGIVNGQDERRFAPELPMSRAEFSAIAVRALGLEPKSAPSFTDVTPGDWFYAAAGTAAAYGMIRGVGDGRFNPGGTITLEEAAVMAARAAGLCGMNTAMDEKAAQNILAQFQDYRMCAGWAMEGLGFCYGRGILPQDELEIRPTEAIKRSEAAEMFYSLLSLAKLI